MSNDTNQCSLGMFLTDVLCNFGLVIDEDVTTCDNIVLGIQTDDFTLKPIAELRGKYGTRKSFYCNNEHIFDYDQETIYLPEPIKSHDLVCRIMDLCGWYVNYVCDDKATDHYIKISSAVSTKTCNTVLILSDHCDEIISETRIVYKEKILISIAIRDDKISLYTMHKGLNAGVYKVVVENKN
jgi:hypothetical protein